MPFDAARVRALVIGSAEIGEIVMRAFILRRVGLIEIKGLGFGADWTSRLARDEVRSWKGFLTRNGYPTTMLLDAAVGERGRELVERFGVRDDELPLMLAPTAQCSSARPTRKAAMCLGITPELDPEGLRRGGGGRRSCRTCDGGEYAASEGIIGAGAGSARNQRSGGRLRADRELPRIPDGHLLAKPSPVGRSIKHSKFGAEIALPLEAARLDCGDSARRRIGPCASNLRPALSSTLASLSHRGPVIGGPTWRIWRCSRAPEYPAGPRR